MLGCCGVFGVEIRFPNMTPTIALKCWGDVVMCWGLWG